MADFIELVESSRWLIDRALSSQESDDFLNLETEQYQAAAPAAVANDNILHALVNDESTYTSESTSPFLSKSAEAELYLLATNFLVGRGVFFVRFVSSGIDLLELDCAWPLTALTNVHSNCMNG
ncbi:unnamed protein product [Pseudo-nitzschia multistriata]|uniref:Uncharacterized protein n=1 Tax=Pseudo-nitzschia multistriata TaxID=183589 RepID=A0A448Z9V3_9STRA|nr:unnamed protein product [Pseudo-nitzschia multistriata]